MRYGAVRVMQVIAAGPVGGAETVVLALSCALRDAGAHVVLAVLADSSSEPFVERAKQVGLIVEVLAASGRNYLRDLVGLRRVLATHHIRLVHTHGYRADMMGLLAARSRHVPSVATAHGFTLGGRRNRLNQRLGLIALRRHHAVIAVSQPLVDGLRRVGIAANRIALIRNAWTAPSRPYLPMDDARRALGLEASALYLGWVGRLSVEKGADLAIESLARISHRGARLAILGEGRELPRLKELAKGLKLAERVIFLGLVPEAARYLPAFDALVLSSRTEGTPMILLEAAKAHVPIVAADVGGVRDIVVPGAGALVQAGDPGALAIGMDSVLSDRVRALGEADAAARHVDENFSAGAWLDRHMALYRSLGA